MILVTIHNLEWAHGHGEFNFQSDATKIEEALKPILKPYDLTDGKDPLVVFPTYNGGRIPIIAHIRFTDEQHLNIEEYEQLTERLTTALMHAKKHDNDSGGTNRRIHIVLDGFWCGD